MEVRSASTLEFIRVPVASTVNGVAVDPTQDDVRIAVIPTGTKPSTPDWHLGSWETDASTGEHFARLLVGPGGAVTLTQGVLYDVYVKITDSPEEPARNTGALAAM